MIPDAESLSLLQVRRKNYFACAAFFVVGCTLYWLVEAHAQVGMIVLQLGCAASFAGLGGMVGAGRLSPRGAKLASVVFSMLAASLLVYLSGGPASPYFQVFGALPCLIAMFTPEDRLPTLIGGAMNLTAVTALDVLADLPTRLMIMQLIGFTMFTALSLFGSRTYRRMGDAKREAQQARLVALEVNNPLAYVKSNLSFLEHEARRTEQPLDRDELCEVLAETRQGVLRIQQIVADLKGFARAGSELQESGRLEEALQEARRLASVRLRDGGEVLLELAPRLPGVQLGQRHLVQVVLNLLINAADAVETALPPRQAHIVVGARWSDEAVHLEVEDNGPGIPEEVLPRLFDPFFTTKPPGKGTGLGLALCREYVTRTGGSLHAENRPQGGARFVLRLPICREPLAA